MAFFEFNIAVSGLFASQRGLSVTSNNITNTNTKGYSRQILEQKASMPMSGMGVGMLGTGVDTTGVKRVRESYLDLKLWSQNHTLGEYRIKTEQSAMVESVFGEPSEDGFTKVFNDMFNAIDDLSKAPKEPERKIVMAEKMSSFTKYFNNIALSLENTRKDLNFELKSKVDEINLLGTRIQSLNKQIYEAEIYGDDANSLRDERELCVDRLSELINVEAKEYEVTEPDGRVTKRFEVKANGQTLVNHKDIRTLDVEVRADGMYDVIWTDKLKFDMGDSNLSGELKGVIDMRDGAGTGPSSSVKYNGIPHYINRLDEFARTFAKTMNETYNKDKDGNQITPPYYLFTYNPGGVTGTPEAGLGTPPDYTLITAANFSISKEIFEDSNSIRANYEHLPNVTDPSLGINPNPSNNDLLLDLLHQKDNADMFKQGDPKDYMVSIFGELGINTQEAQMYHRTQTNVTKTIKLQRLSVSEVSPNEEFTNLVRYQQAYQASAKIINTIDGIYETTIFRLGNF